VIGETVSTAASHGEHQVCSLQLGTQLPGSRKRCLNRCLRGELLPLPPAAFLLAWIRSWAWRCSDAVMQCSVSVSVVAALKGSRPCSQSAKGSQAMAWWWCLGRCWCLLCMSISSSNGGHRGRRRATHGVVDAAFGEHVGRLPGTICYLCPCVARQPDVAPMETAWPDGAGIQACFPAGEVGV
jgi:hypothetical protein